MSEPTTPESTTPESTTPESTTPKSTTPESTTPEPAATAVTAPAPANPVPAAEAPVTAVSVTAVPGTPKKGRAVGVWSFVLGLLAVLGDLALIIFVIVTLFGVISSFQTGNYDAALSALGVAGIGFALVVFIGGFVVASLGALLALIALFTGRGRVFGVFGLLLSLAALGTRISLIAGGLNIAALNGG